MHINTPKINSYISLPENQILPAETRALPRAYTVREVLCAGALLPSQPPLQSQAPQRRPAQPEARKRVFRRGCRESLELICRAQAACSRYQREM